MNCVFCDRIEREEYDWRYEGRNGNPDVVRFEPLNPVTPGHLLFIPVEHVEWDYLGIGSHYGSVAFKWASGFYYGSSFNVITSNGAQQPLKQSRISIST
jgi:histidine triad (HIT) family protein